ncbi:glutathionylspermidine synthase family protein [Escherichia coli]|nr:glutathionylspermidine synthase family protein [Escherichia coli]
MKTGLPCCTCRLRSAGGAKSRFIYIEDLGLGVGGVLTDLDDNVIQRAFKLYPLEWMMRDDNGPLLCKRREQWVEPLWKSILSNKGLMPLLLALLPLVILTFLHPGLRVKIADCRWRKLCA